MSKKRKAVAEADVLPEKEKLKRNKKQKKDKEKKSRLDEELDVPEPAKTDMESVIMDRLSAGNLSTSQEQVKKKKKDKKHKTGSSSVAEKEELNHDYETDGTPYKNMSADHIAPTEIGSVDTDILRQSSVNLGLPMADETPKDTTTQAENTKKKKKKKKDKDKKVKSEVELSEENKDTKPDEDALNYLRLWRLDRKAWKFNKRYQVRLIHNMYNSDKLSDDDFENLLLYLDGMQGKSRDKTRDDAENIVAEESEDKVMQERARQVFQMLS